MVVEFFFLGGGGEEGCYWRILGKKPVASQSEKKSCFPSSISSTGHFLIEKIICLLYQCEKKNLVLVKSFKLKLYRTLLCH